MPKPSSSITLSTLPVETSPSKKKAVRLEKARQEAKSELLDLLDKPLQKYDYLAFVFVLFCWCEYRKIRETDVIEISSGFVGHNMCNLLFTDILSSSEDEVPQTPVPSRKKSSYVWLDCFDDFSTSIYISPVLYASKESPPLHLCWSMKKHKNHNPRAILRALSRISSSPILMSKQKIPS